MIVIVMGVAGSGKSTVGRLLAEATRSDFLDADTLHSPTNVAKMSAAIPLTDRDRGPWLSAVRDRIVDAAARHQNLVVACSALKEAYRTFLASGVPVSWTYLKGSPDVFRRRLQRRRGHFMNAELLNSQLDALEEPTNAIVVDAVQRPQALVAEVVAQLRKRHQLPI